MTTIHLRSGFPDADCAGKSLTSMGISRTAEKFFQAAEILRSEKDKTFSPTYFSMPIDRTFIEGFSKRFWLY